MDQLQSQINNLDYIKSDLDNYNNILEKCAKFHEMNALVYVYDHMKNHDIKPNHLSIKKRKGIEYIVEYQKYK